MDLKLYDDTHLPRALEKPIHQPNKSTDAVPEEFQSLFLAALGPPEGTRHDDLPEDTRLPYWSVPFSQGTIVRDTAADVRMIEGDHDSILWSAEFIPSWLDGPFSSNRIDTTLTPTYFPSGIESILGSRSVDSITTADSGYQSDRDRRGQRRQREKACKKISGICPEPGCVKWWGMNKRELNLHLRHTHNKTPFPCLQVGCDRRDAKGYLREADLKSHQKKKHSRLSQSDKRESTGGGCSNQLADSFSPVMREPEPVPVPVIGGPFETDEAGPTGTDSTGSAQAIPDKVSDEDELPRVTDDVAENDVSSSIFAPSLRTATPQSDQSAAEDNPSEDDDSSSASNYPRSPSPWQEMQGRIVDEDDDGSKANITHCLKWILHNRFASLDQQSRSDARSITNADEPVYDAASIVTEDTTGASNPTDAGASNDGSSSAVPFLNFDRTGSSGKRVASSQEDGSDQSPGENRDSKRARTDSFLASSGKYIRPRYACPYQKYDPIGSPYCCMPNQKNREGGYETFHRVKQHVLRNHDPFVRCNRCWGCFKTEKDAADHEKEAKCIQSPPPAKWWMTAEQKKEVKETRFLGNGDDSWYHLFGLLLPDLPRDGSDGIKMRYSPYYANPAMLLTVMAPLTPSSSPTSSAMNATPNPVLQQIPPADNQGFVPSGTQGNINGQDLFDLDTAGLYDTGNFNETMFGISNGTFVPDVPAMSTPAHIAVDQAEQRTTILLESTLASRNQPAVATLPIDSQPVTSRTTSAVDDSSRLLRNNERMQQTNTQLRAQISRLRGRIAGIAPLMDRLDEVLEEHLMDPAVPEGLHGRISQCHQIVSNLRNLVD